MSSIEQLLATLAERDFCHFNLLFEERFADWVRDIEARLLSPLTDRERTVCYLVHLGKSIKEVAQLMKLSVNTVKSYSKQVHSKLHTNVQHKWLKTKLSARLSY